VGIYHAMILVDLVALSLGVGIIFVALLSWERSGIRWMRDLAFILLAGTILLMLDLLRLYEITAGWPPRLATRIVLAVLSGAGNLMLVMAIPLFVDGITPVPPGLIRRVLRPIGTVVIPLLGVLNEAFEAAAIYIMNDLAIAGLLVSAAIRMAVGYRRIAEPETRRMVIRMMWLTIANIVLARSQLVVMTMLGVGLELRHVRMVQVLYYLGLLAVVLGYAVRYLFRPGGAMDLLLSSEFVEQYDISHRESDIISMIMQGHPNRVIGERLFISDRTVKNHISSIYRKTRAANKVQLINMLRNNPGSRSDSGSPAGNQAASGSPARQIRSRSKT
jgi:DNA-binding CsgD family transcriptional regulator